MYRDIVADHEARLKMKAGLDKVADTVKKTMGVRGKNVVLDTNPYGKPLITNDGVTIARDLLLKDRTENIGAKMVREVAEKTNDNAGDGTTSSMLLMQAMVEGGMKAIASGADGIELRKGITTASKAVLDYLETEKRAADDEESLSDVATVSCRDREIGAMVAKVVKSSGKNGMVTIEDRFEPDTVYEQHEGLKVTGGFPSEHYVNLPERRQSVLSDVPILVTDRVISLAQEMGHIMEVVSKMGKKEAVVIAAGIDGDALLTSLFNWQKNAIFVLPIRVLTYGDLGQGMLRDIAAITGATYLDEHEKNLLETTAQDFGRAAKVVSDKHDTTIISDDKKLKEARVAELEAALETSTEFEKENLRQRIAKLSSAMFSIKVGGKTESERNELKTRVDDAIKAAKAALESGIIAGGGSALYRALKTVPKPDITTDTGIGENIVYSACMKPLEQMAINSNYRLDRTDLKAIEDKTKAIDFSTGEVVDAFKSGIVDPLLVVRECIANASSQAGLFLTLDAAVMDVEPEKPESI